MEISDADIKRAYEERRARYVTPERRHVLQIDFPNAEAASAAAERIAKGASFADIAQGTGQERKGHRSRHSDQSRHDRPNGGRCRLRAQRRGRVARARPVRHRAGASAQDRARAGPPLEQVAGELKRGAGDRARKTEVFDVYNKIEDARAEGKLLAETAATLKLEARTIEAVDRSGRDPAGTPVNLPDAQRLLPLAFTTDVGVERDPAAIPGRLHLV